MQFPEHREYQSEFVKKHVSQGRAEGHAEGRAQEAGRAVVAVLEARGLAISAEHRTRILACTSIDVLEAWIRRAVTVASVEDLFG